MFNISVKQPASVDELINSGYNGIVSISTDALIKLAKTADPRQYDNFYFRDILLVHKNAGFELPHVVYQILSLSDNDDMIDYLLTDSVLNNESITDLLDSGVEFTLGLLSSQPNVTDNQIFEIYMKSGGDEEFIEEEFIEELCEHNRFDLIKRLYQVTTKKELFSDVVFVQTASILLTDQQCIDMMGKPRPEVCPEYIASNSPCMAGWRRMRRHSNRDDAPVSWNILLAKHLLANLNDIDGAKSDWVWYADALQ